MLGSRERLRPVGIFTAPPATKPAGPAKPCARPAPTASRTLRAGRSRRHIPRLPGIGSPCSGRLAIPASRSQDAEDPPAPQRRYAVPPRPGLRPHPPRLPRADEWTSAHARSSRRADGVAVRRADNRLPHRSMAEALVERAQHFLRLTVLNRFTAAMWPLPWRSHTGTSAGPSARSPASTSPPGSINSGAPAPRASCSPGPISAWIRSGSLPIPIRAAVLQGVPPPVWPGARSLATEAFARLARGRTVRSKSENIIVSPQSSRTDLHRLTHEAGTTPSRAHGHAIRRPAPKPELTLPI